MPFDFPNSPSVGQRVTGAGGVVYVWDGVKWTSNVGAVTAQSMGDVGRNLLHNPLFNVTQRGAGAWTAPGYTADRWAMYFANGTMSTTIVPQNEAGRAAMGDEASTSVLQCVFTGGAAVGSVTELFQSIEGVRRLAGKTVTVSFWAWGTGTTSLGIQINQGFGTGGSPSAAVNCGIQGFTITAVPTRYAAVLTLPSVAGKTLGVNGDDSTSLIFLYSSQVVAGIGVQAGTVWLWGVQLEIGSVATPLEKPDPRYDLSNCQRFAMLYPQFLLSGYNTGSGAVFGTVPLVVTMRAAPSVVFSNVTSSNMSGTAVNGGNNTLIRLQGMIIATGSGYQQFDMFMSADL